MQIIKTIKECNTWRDQAHGSIGIVPTMGALHPGHISLIEKSKEQCKKTIVSIYINKPQFNKKNDYNKYPKNINKDINILKKCNVNFLYL